MARFGTMVDMASTPEEIKEKTEENCAPVACAQPRYPYGLCISLDNESMAKLGLDGELPAVGETVHFCAMAKVTSASMNESETSDGKSEQRCRIELQITNMACENEDDENEQMLARRSRFYGASMGNKSAA
jgi:hypothetical protein